MSGAQAQWERDLLVALNATGRPSVFVVLDANTVHPEWQPRERRILCFFNNIQNAAAAAKLLRAAADLIESRES